MEEKPKVIITRTRQGAGTGEEAARKFAFTADMLPAEGALKSYRNQAWEAIPNKLNTLIPVLLI